MQHFDYDWRNRHGFPQGYHYVPTPLELIDLLGDKLAGRPLPDPLCSIFHDVRIRSFNPADLHEQYKEHEEAGSIYFFSEREFAKPGGVNKRPARRTAKGGWKASGGSKAVRTTTNGGVDVGQKLTMVFYEERFPDDKCPAKTDWAMHEFTKIIGPDNKLANMAIYRLYKMRSGKVKTKAGRRCDATIPTADKPTMQELQAPLPPAGGTFRANQANDDEASTSQPQAQAHASIGQTHYYTGKAFGAAVAPAPAPGPSSWVMPVAASPPVQLHDAGNTSYTGFISSPALSMASEAASAASYTLMSQQQDVGQFNYSRPGDWHMPPQMVLPPPPPPPPPPLMASVSEPAALCPPPSSQQQQAASQLDYAKPRDWRMPPQMVLPPPPAPLMASVSEPAALCPPPSQQQLGEEFSCPEHADWDEQLLKTDLLPPLPPPAPAAAGEYMVDEFSAWYDMQQVSLQAGDPWFPMTDEESQLCTFTMDELLGNTDEETAPGTMVAEEADTNNQVQNSTQEEQLVATN